MIHLLLQSGAAKYGPSRSNHAHYTSRYCTQKAFVPCRGANASALREEGVLEVGLLPPCVHLTLLAAPAA